MYHNVLLINYINNINNLFLYNQSHMLNKINIFLEYYHYYNHIESLFLYHQESYNEELYQLYLLYYIKLPGINVFFKVQS